MAANSKEQQKRYDAKRALDRPYNWSLVIYPEDLPDDYEERLKAITPGFMSPLHDQDTNPTGEPKKVHRHVVLCFPSKMPRSRFVSYLGEQFGIGDNGSIKGIADPRACISVTGSVRYMSHADNPEKAQYNRQDIVAWGGKSVDKVWGDDGEVDRANLVRIEEICEREHIVEISDLSKYLRVHNEVELYTLLTERRTVYISAFLTSRRHKVERVESGKTERATESVDMRFLSVDDATGEVVSGCDK